MNPNVHVPCEAAYVAGHTLAREWRAGLPNAAVRARWNAFLAVNEDSARWGEFIAGYNEGAQ